MSLEDVTVSLSRLALAKAIKTPDAEEQDAEPWTKSIIFYQSHIDEQMREQLINPNAKRRTARPMSAQMLVKQKRPPQQDIKRHSYNTQLQQQIQQYKQQPQLQQRTSATSSRSSLSSGKLVHQNHKPGHRYVPSDDEDEDESEDEKEEDDDEDEEEDDKTPIDHKITVTKPTITTTTLTDIATDKKGKSKSHLIAPSDDEDDDEEEEEEEEESESDSDDSDKEDNDHKGKQTEIVTEETYARRMSTLKRLELGNSIHRRTKSTSDVMNLPPPDAFIEPAIKIQVDPIDQWRMTVMEAEDISTPNSTNSSNSLREEAPSTSTTSLSSNVNKDTSSSSRNRRSTMSEMDMVYLQQQQQQHMYNMQLQQAMQYQQAQQMMQIQQYQQALQMQQQQQQQMQQQQQQQQYRSSMMLDPNRAMKQNNRRSVSAMDLMKQMEKEKALFRKNNKKKLPDPSKAKLSTGLLSTVPVQGLHNINFQEYVLKQKKSAQNGDYHQYSRKSPVPSMSMSTPIGYQPAMNNNSNNRQSQYLAQQSKRTSRAYQ